MSKELIRKIKTKFNSIVKKFKKYEVEASSEHYGYSGGYGHGSVEMRATVGGSIFSFEDKVNNMDMYKFNRRNIIHKIGLRIGSGIKFPNKRTEIKKIEDYLHELRQKYPNEIAGGFSVEGTNYWQVEIAILDPRVKSPKLHNY